MHVGALLVRADANSCIGSGHFMRCLTLAQAWQQHGGTAIFLMASGAEGLEKRLEDEGIDKIRLWADVGSNADANETARVAVRHNADWVVLDGYQFSPEYQRTLKEKASHLLVFDDIADKVSYHTDLLLNQNAYATAEMYGNCASDCTLLLGAPYFLLRQEFTERQSCERVIADRAKNLLVTFGGSDPENATAIALQALPMLPAPMMKVRVLVGASNPHRAELEALAAELSHSVEFQTDSKRMADEMAWADVAISAAGSTCWELAFMGLPSLLITLSKDQHGCGQYLHCHGVAISLGWWNQVQPAEIAAALKGLLADPGGCARMSSRGRTLIDGRGAERIIRAMADIASEKTPPHSPLTS